MSSTSDQIFDKSYLCGIKVDWIAQMYLKPTIQKVTRLCFYFCGLDLGDEEK
jgi:hypothetical protein